MSKCDRYLPDLSAWVDGELEDSRELEAHLAECASCRAKAAAYRRLDLQIANVVPPKNLHSHIMAGIDGSLSKKKRLRAPWKGTLATAAALLVVLGAGLLTRPYWGSSPAALDAANQTAMELDAPAASPAAADTAAETTVTTAVKTAQGDDPVEEETALDEGAAQIPAPEPATNSGKETEDTAGLTAQMAEEEFALEPESPAEALAPEEELTGMQAVEGTASGGDMDLYDDAGDVFTVYSGTLTQEDLLNVESLLAGGQQLVWTIYNDDDQDTLEELKNAYEPLQVRDENLWIMTMESTEVLSLYQALWEELGGDLTTSDNRTGSIVLDLR